MNSPIMHDSQLAYHLGHELKRWSFTGHALWRKIHRKNWQQVMTLANQISLLAEEQNHHPNLGIAYGLLTIELYSHDEKAITQRDITLAQDIEKLIQPLSTSIDD